MNNLELRAYGFITRNISDIAAGIQFGHAMVELSLMDDPIYEDFARNHKTFVLLKGGSTNKNPNNKGELNRLFEEIVSLNVCNVAPFYEPDLGNQMTAFSFIVDERVFNHIKYPLFSEWLNNKYPKRVVLYHTNNLSLEEQYPVYFIEYLELVGGENNYTLKKILANSRPF